MALIVFHDDEKERHKGLEDDVGSSAGPDDGQRILRPPKSCFEGSASFLR